MSLSANEVTALLAKAARGAGAPPEQAAAFGRAACHHLGTGGTPDILLAAIEALPQGPILTLPLILQRLLEDGTTMQPKTPLLESYVATLPFRSNVAKTNDGLQITLNLQDPPPPRVPSRITLSSDMLARLSTLAARTFVPETEASRTKGAGAGLTDND